MSVPSSIPRILDSDSDSEDDVPLSSLRSAKAPVLKEEIKTEMSSHNVKKNKRETRSESESDDEIPISGLANRNKKLKIETNVKREEVTMNNPRSTLKSTPRKVKKRIIKIKIRQQECTEQLYQTLKGQLAQELLCRWWYAMEWPPTKTLTSKVHGVQELDGFPGAYIRVKGDDLGSIIDTRLSAGKPSFLHFFAMSSEDLQKLLLLAYDKQMEVLIDHEGSDTPLLKELQKARASAARINTEKADRSIQKVLKSFAELEREIKAVKALALKEENTSDEGEEDDNDDDDAADD
ncbi:unnamed protein product [Peronospora farinosa]|uniref:Uncharacterized protein n=1 Tax=Peronospora farinosa TaxID=134698 RepID=A0AAV0TVC1_9STRA|nr:unnamed protein product [Peronospora farinosa]CAI5726467.1 unnamed protein product [Peronospora farinosa]